MKTTFFFILLFTSNFYAQTFQWGKRGGATDALDITSSNLRQEEVYDIVTDSQKNIYILSAVGKNGLDVDGVTKTNFGENTQVTDIALASFSCDGSYRWSKIIGGSHFDFVNGLSIDQLDNIYIAGRFGSCGNTAYPPRIDNDVIINQTPTDCSVNFLAKYNSNGLLQWIRRPQTAVTSVNAFSIGMNTDASGNSYWLLQLPVGAYADGAFINNMPGRNFFILKYNTNGNYVSATHLEMQLSNGGFLSSAKFYRNPYNSYFYVTSSKSSSSETASAGGQSVTGSTILACFNDLGNFQWMRQDTSTIGGAMGLYKILFDTDNNLYIAGKIVGLNTTSFIGLTVPEGIVASFVMKTNTIAQNKLWGSYYNVNGAENGAIALKNNEIGFAGYCFSTNFTWGTQTLNVNGENQGTEALLARFDKNNGNCLGLTRIIGETGYDDGGAALAVDASGDYIYGGYAGRGMTFTTNSLLATGIQSDFFVAKYSTAVCSPLGNEQFENTGLQLYPNPAETFITLNITDKINYAIYNEFGIQVKKGIISPENNTINTEDLNVGFYVIALINGDNVKTVKLIKK